MSRTGGSLARRLGLLDAVVLGLGSMLGAGVFVAFAPAAQQAGGWLLAGLAVAASVAWANARSSARLAARMPQAGGSYLYGRTVLGPWWGFLAGWGFVVGKSASGAAMALTVAAYLVPEAWTRPVAGAVAAAGIALGYRGVTRTARATGVLVAVVLAGLATVLLATAGQEPAGFSLADLGTADVGPLDVLGAAGLLFFAFAGYARVATLGEEVRDPARTIPRAIAVALVLTVAVYTLVGAALLVGLGPEALAASTAPVADLAARAGPGVALVARVAAVAAATGALLALLAGLGRTTLAMARHGDLPRALDAVHPVHGTPHRAELAVGLVVVVLAAGTDLRGAIGFSSFGVLVYYLVANLAARRVGPRVLASFGAAGCVVLALSLPAASVVGGITVLGAGVLGRLVVLRRRAAADG